MHSTIYTCMCRSLIASRYGASTRNRELGAIEVKSQPVCCLRARTATSGVDAGSKSSSFPMNIDFACY